MRVSYLLPLLAASPAITSSLEAVERGEFTRRDLVEIERSIQARGLVEEIWDKIKSAATCGGCEVRSGCIIRACAIGRLKRNTGYLASSKRRRSSW